MIWTPTSDRSEYRTTVVDDKGRSWHLRLIKVPCLAAYDVTLSREGFLATTSCKGTFREAKKFVDGEFERVSK